jgi:hypothetical protein
MTTAREQGADLALLACADLEQQGTCRLEEGKRLTYHALVDADAVWTCGERFARLQREKACAFALQLRFGNVRRVAHDEVDPAGKFISRKRTEEVTTSRVDAMGKSVKLDVTARYRHARDAHVARPNAGFGDMNRNCASEITGSAAHIDHERCTVIDGKQKSDRRARKQLGLFARHERARSHYEVHAHESRGSLRISARNRFVHGSARHYAVQPVDLPVYA